MVARTFFGVKIRAKIKKDFLEAVYEEGLSTCQIIEALMVAWVEGRKAVSSVGLNQKKGVPPITINQRFERVVKRGGRRSFREFVPEPNFYNAKAMIWEFRDVDREMLLPNGHAAGCQCSKCRRGPPPFR